MKPHHLLPLRLLVLLLSRPQLFLLSPQLNLLLLLQWLLYQLQMSLMRQCQLKLPLVQSLLLLLLLEQPWSSLHLLNLP